MMVRVRKNSVSLAKNFFLYLCLFMMIPEPGMTFFSRLIAVRYALKFLQPLNEHFCTCKIEAMRQFYFYFSRFHLFECRTIRLAMAYC